MSNFVMLTPERRDNMIELLTEGLCTDGGHHKQWYLECVLKELVGETDFKSLQELNEWEEGTPG